MLSASKEWEKTRDIFHSFFPLEVLFVPHWIQYQKEELETKGIFTKKEGEL